LFFLNIIGEIPLLYSFCTIVPYTTVSKQESSLSFPEYQRLAHTSRFFQVSREASMASPPIDPTLSHCFFNKRVLLWRQHMREENMPELRFNVHSGNLRLRPSELEKMRTGLGSLRRAVRDFPVSELRVDITHFPRSKDFQVRATLFLPKHQVFMGRRDQVLHVAYRNCLDGLLEQVRQYKENLENKATYEKLAQHTAHEFLPTAQPDLKNLEHAARQQDYPAFRDAIHVYDEALQARIGRWIRRYPKVEAQLGRQFLLSEIVEQVYLNAFGQFLSRPDGAISEWLEDLIDPSIKALIRNAEEEITNVRFIESAD
jgi:hypothetical protein